MNEQNNHGNISTTYSPIDMNTSTDMFEASSTVLDLGTLSGQVDISFIIAIVVALVISVVFNIIVCAKKSYQFFTSRNCSAKHRQTRHDSATAHQPGGMDIAVKEADQILETNLSQQDDNSYEYEPFDTSGQNLTNTALMGHTVLPSSVHASAITKEQCKGSEETLVGHTPFEPTQTFASSYDQKTPQMYENVNVSDFFCSSVPTESDDFYESVGMADQHNVYISLQKSDHSSDTVYEALQK